MGVENLLSLNRPYVHSSVINFRLALRDLVGVSTAQKYRETNKQFQDNLNTLTKISTGLKKETNEFCQRCGAKDWIELNRMMFGSSESNDMHNIFLRALTNTQLAEEIVKKTISVSDLEKKLSNNEVSQQVIKAIKDKQKNSISVNRLSDLIIQSLGEGFIKDGKGKPLTRKQQEEMLSAIGLPTGSSGGKGFQTLQSKELKKTIRNIIIGTFKKNLMTDRDALCSFFIKFYNEEEANVKTSVGYSSPNDNEIRQLFNQVITDDMLLETIMSSLLGDLGEEGISTVLNDTDLVISTRIGDMSEIEIKGKYEGKIKQLVIHTSENKQSRSDLLWTTPDKSMTVRVQSKNSLLKGVRAQFLQTQDKAEDYPIIHNILMAGSADTTARDLLNQLVSPNGDVGSLFTEEQGKVVAYILANMAWFNRYSDYSTDSRVKKTGNYKESGFEGPRQLMMNLLSFTITDLLGISRLFNVKDMDNLEENFTSSNIFVLVGNRQVVPTYLIIDDIIDNIKDLYDDIQTAAINLIWEERKMQPIYKSAAGFHQAKIDRSGALVGRDYTDANLLSVGQEQGESIMVSLPVHINLNLNMRSLFNKTSYDFNYK